MSTTVLRSRRRPLAAVAVLCLLSSIGLVLRPADAQSPTSDPPTAAEYAAAWLASQVQPDGTVPGGFDALGDAADAALALAAAGVGGDAFDRAVGAVATDIDAFLDDPFLPGSDSAGRLGKALLLAELAGIDPTSFGGTDLVARAQASLGLYEPGLYGAGGPFFDGAFRQGWVILGLVAVGVAPDATAVQWLLDQQCDGTNPAAAGGWQAYRADTLVACSDPDPNTFSGPDTNSTALAVQALAAVGSAPGTDPLGFFTTYQEADGGWAFIPGSGTDPSSTGLVVQALLASGEDPAAWEVGGLSPYDLLLAFQLGCDAPEADRGALESTFAPGAPDVFSTTQATPALAGVAFPQDGPVDLPAAAEPVDCTPPDPGSTTSTTVPGDEVTPLATSPQVPQSTTAQAVTTQGSPSLTG